MNSTRRTPPSALTFLFAPESPRPLAFMRIGLGALLFYEAACRWPFAVELYSADGLPVPPFPGTVFEPAAMGASATILLHSWLLFSLLAVTLGWHTRTSLWIALVLSAWFGLLDAAGTLTKYSVIGLHLMLLLSLSNCAAVGSLDRWLRPEGNRFVELAPAWPRRLMQLLLLSIYWGAAVTKLRVPDFATGDLLMFSLLSDRWGGTRLGLWLSTQPKLLVLLSLATVFFEILFPVLVWIRKLRRPMLLCAVLFHGGLWMTMDLGVFSPVMLVALLAFVNERDAPTPKSDKAQRWQPGGLTGRPWALARFDSRLSAAVYCLLCAFWAAGGWGIQYAGDWYGVFGSSTKKQWPMINQGEFDVMRAEQEPAFQDYFHRVALGSRLGHFHVFGTEQRFQPGMTVHVLARLIQDHPPLQLDWILLAPNGEEVGRLSRRLEASYSHATAGFRLTDDLPTGRYRIILRADGHEVARTSFKFVR